MTFVEDPGAPGTGRSHFTEALGQAAVDAGKTVTSFAIDDLGGLPPFNLGCKGAELWAPATARAQSSVSTRRERC